MKWLVLLCIANLLAGCMVMVPGPIYKMTLNGILGSGSLSATLQDGEVCSGSWAPVRQDDPSAGSMSGEWDSVYGSGFFVGNVLGKLTF